MSLTHGWWRWQVRYVLGCAAEGGLGAITTVGDDGSVAVWTNNGNRKR